MRTTFLIFIILVLGITLHADEGVPLLPFKQVVLWGHKLHSHTHSYIHYAFDKAFSHLGYKTYWLDDSDDVSNIDFSDSLFITEGQVDEKIPLRSDCTYILHNCYSSKYNDLYKQGNCITLQVFTHACTTRNVQKIEDYIYYDIENKTIYMPWATDLLPHEIDTIKNNLGKIKKRRSIFFVGTIGAAKFGNIPQIDPFKKACQQNGIKFQQGWGLSEAENIALIQKSCMAPAIQGEWQCREGYIPCRIFKNISYGQFGITNSETVYNLFNKKIIYHPDTYQLFHKASKQLQNLKQHELHELMDFVRDHHTYLNRIRNIFDFIVLIGSQ